MSEAGNKLTPRMVLKTPNVTPRVEVYSESITDLIVPCLVLLAA